MKRGYRRDSYNSCFFFRFMKVGNNPKVAETHQGSWRQAILNSVVTPSKGMDASDVQSEYLSPMRITRMISLPKLYTESHNNPSPSLIF